jgi:uncharacterized membrane protein YphA (DoxX/SURF4 family)
MSAPSASPAPPSPAPSPPPAPATPPPSRPAKLFALGARILLVVLLLAAAWPKLRDPAAFAVAINNYRLLPPSAAGLIAHCLPWLELVTALGLLAPSPLRRQGAWLLACALAALFFAAQTSAWLRGLDISCGCFGTPGRIDGLSVFTRLLLLALTCAAYLQACAPRSSRQ